MKRLITVAAVLLATATLANAAEVTPGEYCAATAKMATALMTVRQAGSPMVKAMEVADAAPSEAMRDVMRTLVMAAYKQPRFHSREMIDEAVTEFSNEIYSTCLQAVKK